MQSTTCQKHNLKKEFAFCLEPNCKDRLVCKKCFMMDRQHNDHQRICIEYLMNSDKDELVRLFNETYAETIKDSQNFKQFSELLDARFNKFMDKREETIRLPFEKMISDYRLSLQKLKIQLCQKYKVDQVKSIAQIQQSMQQLIDNDSSEQKQQEMKEMIDSSNQIIDIQNKLDSVFKQIEKDDEQIVNRIQYVIDSYKTKIDAQIAHTTNDLEGAKQLNQCTRIQIDNISIINDYKKQIEQHQQQGTQFKIYLYFYSISDPNHRKQVMDMIEQSNVNHRVAEMAIRIDNSNKNDVELVTNMLNRYTNIYWIYIYDCLDQVDNKIHDQLKALVEGRTILQLYVGFYGSIKTNDDGLNLLKQYNQLIIKDKDHLSRLYYYGHSRISRDTQQKEQIQQMINEVSNM